MERGAVEAGSRRRARTRLEGEGEIDHGDGGGGGFGAFVAETAAGSIEGLLLVVDGEDSEDYGGCAFGVQHGYAVGCDFAYVVEVGGVASDYATDYYYGFCLVAVTFAGSHSYCRSVYQFYGAWD